MTFDEYQRESKKTAIYPSWGNNFIYPSLGLTSEAGEVAGKVKKIVRDKGGIADEQTKQEIGKELGDTLWYLSQLATELGLSLSTLAEQNLAKLQSRQKRRTLHGDGDNR
ncbi:MAG: nucleoside triphosphate pyrophosphohydrolase family protein [Patescibacteria group bacterium]